MAALGWILNLGFAGESAEAQAAEAKRKAHEWVAAYVYAHGASRPAFRRNYASYGASVTTPGTRVVDVLELAEGTVHPLNRVPVNLTRFSAGTAIPAEYKVVTETSGESVP